MDNVNMDKYEPYLYPNVDGQCDLDSNLPKKEMVDKFETQITAAHVQGDEKAHLSQQQDTSDARTSHVGPSPPQGHLKVWCFQKRLNKKLFQKT